MGSISLSFCLFCINSSAARSIDPFDAFLLIAFSKDSKFATSCCISYSSSSHAVIFVLSFTTTCCSAFCEYDANGGGDGVMRSRRGIDPFHSVPFFKNGLFGESVLVLSFLLLFTDEIKAGVFFATIGLSTVVVVPVIAFLFRIHHVHVSSRFLQNVFGDRFWWNYQLRVPLLLKPLGRCRRTSSRYARREHRPKFIYTFDFLKMFQRRDLLFRSSRVVCARDLNVSARAMARLFSSSLLFPLSSLFTSKKTCVYVCARHVYVD